MYLRSMRKTVTLLVNFIISGSGKTVKYLQAQGELRDQSHLYSLVLLRVQSPKEIAKMRFLVCFEASQTQKNLKTTQ